MWDPHHVTAVAALEKVQKLAFKICTKNWAHNNYSSLLEQCKLPSLETRRLYLKLCYLYQVVNGYFIFPNAPLVRRSLPPGLRNANSTQFVRPSCSINAYHFFSFHVQSPSGTHFLKKSSQSPHYNLSNTTWNLTYINCSYFVSIMCLILRVHHFCWLFLATVWL